MRAIYEPRGAALEYAPLALNLHRGCVHGCRYCYAPACLRMSPADFHAKSEVRPGILEALEADCRRLQRAGMTAPELAEQVGEHHHRRVLLCFTSDPYQPGDNSTTRRALEILHRYHVPATVLTKGGLRAARDFDLMAEMGCWFGTSMVWRDDSDRDEWEPHAANLADRWEAVQEAYWAGIRTWLSIEPVIDPWQAVGLIETSWPCVHEFRVGKLNHHPAAADVDWHEWAPRLLRACQDSGRSYLIKESLRPYLPEGAEVRREVGGA